MKKRPSAPFLHPNFCIECCKSALGGTGVPLVEKPAKQDSLDLGTSVLQWSVYVGVAAHVVLAFSL